MSVAYLFTLREPDFHPLERTWSSYLRSCPPGSAVVRSHAGKVSNASSPHGGGGRGAFAGSSLPVSIQVRRFDYSMVRARLLLLHDVLDRKPRDATEALEVQPEWLLFLSDSCAPLLPCADVHAYLRAQGNRSFVGAGACDDPRRMHSTRLTVETCRSTLGWVGLHRSAALRILEKERVYARDFVRLGVPDESYWSTVLFSERLPVLGRPLTYMSWNGKGKGHGGGAHPDEIQLDGIATFRVNRLIIEHRDTALQQGYVFGRKFEASKLVDNALATIMEQMPHNTSLRDPLKG
ncbi:hypothetical protein AB1Y20_003089 [Prymnesium parvum]|uniref:Protein xylosyltransferase n=1 Tax=Prymnesium parvum TaxID=97485 RepID=A0AB34JAW3_PRYPA